MYGFPLSTQKASLLQGKVLDKSEFMHMDVVKHGTLDRLAGTPRARRTPAVPRARPKTIHVDSGALHAAEGMLHTKQPSSTNLAGKHFDEISPTASLGTSKNRCRVRRHPPLDLSVRDRHSMTRVSADQTAHAVFLCQLNNVLITIEIEF